MDFFPSPFPLPDQGSQADLEQEPDWKIYEGAIAHIEESYKDCTVIRNHKVIGERSGVERQVDVWLSAKIGDDHIVTVAIECRRYSRPVSIKDIDAFCGFLEDVGASKGVMISHSGYTNGAEKRAGRGIELKVLTVEEAEEFDWDEFVGDRCETFGECLGTLSWAYTDGQSAAGHCHSCGTFHISCGQCGLVSFYDEQHIVKCSGCNMSWELELEKGEVSGIAELPLSEEEDSGDDEDDD